MLNAPQKENRLAIAPSFLTASHRYNHTLACHRNISLQYFKKQSSKQQVKQGKQNVKQTVKKLKNQKQCIGIGNSKVKRQLHKSTSKSRAKSQEKRKNRGSMFCSTICSKVEETLSGSEMGKCPSLLNEILHRTESMLLSYKEKCVRLTRERNKYKSSYQRVLKQVLNMQPSSKSRTLILIK